MKQAQKHTTICLTVFRDWKKDYQRKIVKGRLWRIFYERKVMKDRLWRKDREGNTEGEIVKGRLKDRLRVKNGKRRPAEMWKVILTIFPHFWWAKGWPMDRRTNRWTNGLMDGRADGRTFPLIEMRRDAFKNGLTKFGYPIGIFGCLRLWGGPLSDKRVMRHPS